MAVSLGLAPKRKAMAGYDIPGTSQRRYGDLSGGSGYSLPAESPLGIALAAKRSAAGVRMMHGPNATYAVPPGLLSGIGLHEPYTERGRFQDALFPAAQPTTQPSTNGVPAIRQAAAHPGEYKSPIDYNAPMPFGHMGAPLQNPRPTPYNPYSPPTSGPQRPALGLNPYNPPATGPSNAAPPAVAPLGPLSQQLLAGQHPITGYKPAGMMLPEPNMMAGPELAGGSNLSLGGGQGGRLTPQQVLGIASGKYASSGRPSTVGLGLAVAQARGREGSAMSGTDRDRLASRMLPDGSGLAPVRPGEGVLEPGGMDLKERMDVAKLRLNAAIDRRHNGFEPSASGMNPQEKYDMRQFNRNEEDRAKQAAMRGPIEKRPTTARQVRMQRNIEAQQRGFEQNLGLASPGAYAGLQQARGAQALAKSQHEATQLGLAEDRKLRRDALSQQGTLAGQREEEMTRRAQMNAQANVLAHGGDTSALGLAGAVASPEQQQKQEAAAANARTPQELEEKIKNLPPGTQQAIRQQYQQEHAPSIFDRIVNSPAVGSMTEGVPGGLTSVNPFAVGSAIGRIAPSLGLGYQAPPPVRAGRFPKPKAPAKK